MWHFDRICLVVTNDEIDYSLNLLGCLVMHVHAVETHDTMATSSTQFATHNLEPVHHENLRTTHQLLLPPSRCGAHLCYLLGSSVLISFIMTAFSSLNCSSSAVSNQST